MDGTLKRGSEDWQRQMIGVLRASGERGFPVGKYARRWILKTFEKEVAPNAIDLLIWDLEVSGELDPFT